MSAPPNPGRPEMVYLPPQHQHHLHSHPANPTTTTTAADPVLGYRVYPPTPSQSHDGSNNYTRGPSPTVAPSSPAATRKQHHHTHDRNRQTGKSASSSLSADSLSSTSADSVHSRDHALPIPKPVRTQHRHSKPERLSHHNHRDLEAQRAHAAFSDPFRSPVPVSLAEPAVVTYADDDDDDGRPLDQNRSDKALRICLYLSTLSPIVSLMNTLWSLIALFIALILQPLRLCSFRQSFHEELISLLAPPLNMQIKLVYGTVTTARYNLPMVIVVHLFSPLVAMGVAVASWTAAFFWFYAVILGDPTKTDKRSDGKATVLAVRDWWEGWLRRGLR